MLASNIFIILILERSYLNWFKKDEQKGLVYNVLPWLYTDMEAPHRDDSDGIVRTAAIPLPGKIILSNIIVNRSGSGDGW
jgi:hypothetical protein